MSRFWLTLVAMNLFTRLFYFRPCKPLRNELLTICAECNLLINVSNSLSYFVHRTVNTSHIKWMVLAGKQTPTSSCSVLGKHISFKSLARMLNFHVASLWFLGCLNCYICTVVILFMFPFWFIGIPIHRKIVIKSL